MNWVYFLIHFSVVPIAALRYSGPIRFVSTYVLPAMERRLLRKSYLKSLKFKSLVCEESDIPKL